MTDQSQTPAPILGPILFVDDVRDGALHLAALFIAAGDAVPGELDAGAGPVAPAPLAEVPGHTVWRARFTLPADRPSAYAWGGAVYPVASDLTGDLRLAYVSCNGEEVGDMDRAGSERNAMWGRLTAEHGRAPFALLIHGGDQVYADEATHGHPLTADWPDDLPATDPSPAALADLRAYLRARFAERYIALAAAPQFAHLAARVPSLMVWDDHDICDGWGSLKASRTQSALGQLIFAVAREMYLLFQHACVPGDLPPRFADPQGAHLGWHVAAPGLRLVAPDLRSERGRRNVMGPGGWALVDGAAGAAAPGRTFLVSSVPLLGPRLSVLEALMVAVPRMQKYEDDLRDQWQSRAHRAEWRRMLAAVAAMGEAPGQDVTALSGEIHLATRAEMALAGGGMLHQLVASGIAHRPPPRAWASALGWLASLGDSPLPGHPIRIRRIPGARGRYVAERNYLVLERQGRDWTAAWEMERTGRSGRLAL
jgi:hypothetical protein